MSQPPRTIIIRDYHELEQYKDKKCESCNGKFLVGDKIHSRVKNQKRTHYHFKHWEETFH